MTFELVPTLVPRNYPEVIIRSKRRAHGMIKHYEKQPTKLSGNGIEKDFPKQFLGAVAECMYCAYRGIPFELIPWWERDSNKFDGGIDVIDHGLPVDVKHTQFGWRLIWPLWEKDLWPLCKAEVLVAISGDLDRMKILGWETKNEFARLKKEADGVTPDKIFKGTWYIETLRPIDQIKFYTSELCDVTRRAG